ncbi:Coatomer beta subunit, partial [Giardia duodenalis]
VVNLEPYGFARDKHILYVDSCEAGVIYGNIAAGFKRGKQKMNQEHTRLSIVPKRLILIFDHFSPLLS